MPSTITGNGIDKVIDSSIHEVDLNADVARLGIGQTWQDVTASRALNITYTNSTGKPIQFNVVSDIGASTVVLNGVSIASNDGSSYGFINFIVPNGHTYRINGTGTIVSWAELR